MLCKVYCACSKGLDVFTITVEVDVSSGISFYLVGLPDNAVKESQQRISCALSKYGYKIPGKKIIVNLAPANLKKEGSAFDLAIAIGIIQASEQVEFINPQKFLILGELALDGSLRAIKGALPIILHAKDEGFAGCILPYDSAIEGREIDNFTIFGADNLREVIEILKEPELAAHYLIKERFTKRAIEEARIGGDRYDNGGTKNSSSNSYNSTSASNSCSNFKFVKGQQMAKRGLEIAAAGGHNVIMVGSPGSGKTMMAKCLASILPPMSSEEAIETSKIYSVAGLFNAYNGLIRERPFREPHHTSTVQALAGSGLNGIPGEISLAHNGVLFLDEFAEFPRYAIEILRQPLEERVIQICRAKSRVCYPASFMLVAAMNPCPCGYLHEPNGRCRCSSSAITKYSAKISGPILDRIDIQLTVRPVGADIITASSVIEEGESSEVIAARVLEARELQLERFRNENFYTNANIPQSLLHKYCEVGERERKFLKKLVESSNLSARGYSRLLKISRTIADLDGKDFISLSHISQAMQFRVFTTGIVDVSL